MQGHDHRLPEGVQVLSPPANTSVTVRFFDRSNSEEGTLPPLLQKAIHLTKQFRADIGKRVEDSILEIKLLFDNFVRNLSPQKSDLFLQIGPFRICERLSYSYRYEPKPNVGWVLDSRMRGRSPSPSGSWSDSSLESVGTTSEEWVFRGWNVFLGSWG